MDRTIKKYSLGKICGKCDMIDYCISRQILTKTTNKMPKVGDSVKKWQDWMFIILNGLPTCEVKLKLMKKYRGRIKTTKRLSECLRIAHRIFTETGVVDCI